MVKEELRAVVPNTEAPGLAGAGRESGLTVQTVSTYILSKWKVR
jgi:hypothetical protein